MEIARMSATSTTSSAASAASRSHEALNRLESWLAQRERQLVLTRRDGLLTEVEERDGRHSRYCYNQVGDLSRIAEEGGCEILFCYDDRRRLRRVERGEGETTSYHYGANDRLIAVEDRGVRFEFDHDEAGRLAAARRGNAGAVVYRYDTAGRVTVGRTSRVSTEQEFDASGRFTAIHQTMDGVRLTLRLAYDAAGRLSELRLPGCETPIRYQWNERGWPAAVHSGERPIADFDYREPEKFCRVRFANGVEAQSWADEIDGRLTKQSIAFGAERLIGRELSYDATGKLLQDGVRRYEYDAQNRLTGGTCLATGADWRYGYDSRGNIIAIGDDRLAYDAQDRLAQIVRDGAAAVSFRHDRLGRLTGKVEPQTETIYRYDDAGQLVEVSINGETAAQFTYDHKGRMVAMQSPDGFERFLYGPADELFAVTNEAGEPLRLFVRTPFGCLAEIHGDLESGAVFFSCEDERGVCRLVTDEAGRIVARPQVDPFGAPLSPDPFAAPRSFGGRRWFPGVRLYYFGARWYDPELARFLTPDSYTAQPDDARIVNALGDASAQAIWREQLLPDWLKLPGVRRPYDYCGSDPVNGVDPNGHWSFGGVLLSLLGAIWTLPNTLFGLLIEITCLVGEVIRWLVWLVTIGNVSWQTPGFDVAASGRLNAFALVFTGGWLGSFPKLLGITFGNVIFVYKDWRNNPKFSSGGVVSPPAYHGTVSFPRDQALYEHELRHTNQYGWFGPFFHLGLPLWGVYEWDVIVNGYRNAWLERNARDFGGA
jgi:RHS repeat-associated protein